jgi:hypothetical protein
MVLSRYARTLTVAAIGSALGALGCGGSPTSPSSSATTQSASIAIVGLTATVEPLTTTPQPGLLYRLMYQVRESGGRTGATLITQHFAFSNGASADGNFSSAQIPPHVGPLGTITVESTYSVFPASVPATHVDFSIGYDDDRGKAGTASAGADISRVGM